MSHRVLQRVLAAISVAASVLISAAPAIAGNQNAGDVWVDNVGQLAGPGHEMDPHLACANINLWGAKLADPSGSYTIDGWPPSGGQQQAYSSTWTVQSAGLPIDVINVQTLVANAIANGDVPQANQGFHFKLQFSADPQKHKTFWVSCPMPSNNPTPPPGGGNTPPPGGGSTPPNGGTTTSISATKLSIGSVKTLKCPRGTTRGMRRVRGHKRVACIAKRKRHIAAKHRTRRPVVRRDPLFAG